MAGLVDHLGRPISTQALKREQAPPTLMGVRSVITGHPADGLTPQRLAGILRGAEHNDHERYLELAEQMEEKYLHYLSVMGTRKRAVTQLEISVEAADDSAEAERHATFVRDWIKRDELESELFDVLDAVGKGFSCTEIVWDTSESQWMPQRLERRDPRWFMFDRADGRTPLLRGMAAELEPLNPYGWIVHEHKAKSGLPIRGGLARPAAWAYLFQNYALKDWVAFAEVFGLPLRLGKYDNGETVDNIKLLMRAVAGVSSDAAAVIPKSMDLEFVDGKAVGSTDLFERLCAYIDQQVSKAVVGQTATTDSVTGGLGSGKEHGDVRDDIQRADAKQVAASLTRDLARPMVDLNFGPQKKYPRLLIGRTDAWDPAKMMPQVKIFVELGGKVGMRAIGEKLGLEEPEDDEELLVSVPGVDARDPEPPPGDPAASSPRTAGGGGALPAPRRGAATARPALSRPLKGQPGAEPTPAVASVALNPAEGEDAIDVLTDEALNDWAEIVAPVTGPIADLVASCSTLEELRGRLAQAIGAMDVGAITEILARASFNARLAGEVGEETQP